MSQGRRQNFARTFRKNSCKRGVLFGYFGMLGELLGLYSASSAHLKTNALSNYERPWEMPSRGCWMREGSDGFSQASTPAGISRIRTLPGKQVVLRESERTLFVFSTALSPARLTDLGFSWHR